MHPSKVDEVILMIMKTTRYANTSPYACDENPGTCEGCPLHIGVSRCLINEVNTLIRELPEYDRYRRILDYEQENRANR